MAGHSHIWHEIYSLPHTWVIGFVACRVTSKCLGIRAGERSSSDVKMIKDRKRSNLSGDSLEKQAILYISVHLAEARIRSEHKCSNNFGTSLQMKIWSKSPFIVLLILWTLLIYFAVLHIWSWIREVWCWHQGFPRHWSHERNQWLDWEVGERIEEEELPRSRSKVSYQVQESLIWVW